MKLYYKDFEVEGNNMEINQFIRDNIPGTVSNVAAINKLEPFGPSELPTAEDFKNFKGWRKDDTNEHLLNFFELRNFLLEEYDTLTKKKVEVEKQENHYANSLYLSALNSRLELLETLKKMAFAKEANDDK